MEPSVPRPLPRRTIRCVAVGDRIFGKPVCSRQSPHGFRLSMPFESYSAELQIGDEPCTLNLFYAADRKDLDGLRPQQWYQQADVFLVCFPVDSPGALVNVRAR
uniref:Cell division control protein 42 homolog n=2 Tax=Culex pipiens TaxID=7175 RepID=A0A8D8ETH3_CULPI